MGDSNTFAGLLQYTPLSHNLNLNNRNPFSRNSPHPFIRFNPSRSIHSTMSEQEYNDGDELMSLEQIDRESPEMWMEQSELTDSPPNNP